MVATVTALTRLIVMMFALTAAAFLQAASPFPADPDCSMSGDGSTVAMVACLSGQSELWDRRLNDAYRAALKRAEIEPRKLRYAQRAWLKYRDANCAAYASVQGSISRILATKCWRDVTRDRAIELHEMTWTG